MKKFLEEHKDSMYATEFYIEDNVVRITIGDHEEEFTDVPDDFLIKMKEEYETWEYYIVDSLKFKEFNDADEYCRQNNGGMGYHDLYEDDSDYCYWTTIE